jgi:hypothetical protein
MVLATLRSKSIETLLRPLGEALEGPSVSSNGVGDKLR